MNNAIYLTLLYDSVNLFLDQFLLKKKKKKTIVA
jgi:hypothetical protein